MRHRHLTARTAAVGVGTAFAALFLLSLAVGVDGVAAAVAAADPLLLVGVALASLLWLCVWSVSLYVVSHALSIAITPSRTLLVYASATFLNGLTPFAQVGGEALSAGVLSRTAGSRYETGLAAVAAVDLINLVPSALLALAGTAYLLVGSAPAPGVGPAGGVLIAVSALAVVAGTLAWRFRAAGGAGLARTGARAVELANRVAERYAGADPGAVGRRAAVFADGVRRLAADRRRLAVCLGFSTVGWLCLAAALWLSLRAVGAAVPFLGLCFALPVAMLAIAVPLPGGVGGVEAALVALLVGTFGLPPAETTAAVLLYRGGTYWLPMLLGGGATLALEVDHRRRRRK